MPKTALVLFRNDLRLQDNPAINFAISSGYKILPIFLWEEDEIFRVGSKSKFEKIGAASKLYLQDSLSELDRELRSLGSKLFISRKSSPLFIENLAHDLQISAVFWNRRYEPFNIEKDKELKENLSKKLETKSFNASLLIEPWELKNKSGKAFQVFTPYWKEHTNKLEESNILGSFKSYKLSSENFFSLENPLKASAEKYFVEISELNLEPKLSWKESLRASYNAGEKAVLKKLSNYINSKKINEYPEKRDFMSEDACSKLSANLHFGEISALKIYTEVQKAIKEQIIDRDAGLKFLRQLVWREFNYQLIYHYPHSTDEDLKENLKHFKWQEDKEAYERWTQGLTGYPIVDAAMRELWATGLMHNRVRMMVASFLVKDLLIPWQWGALWFWDTLIDADLANNSMGWQWTAGTGADAAPFFRIFSPSSQTERFDPELKYIRKWIPELDSSKYPKPMIDHALARERALKMLKS
jgi:deoxyribodipyrimidine photo-lyase